MGRKYNAPLMIISTPAKIILSGEHSVLYGAPALGMPLDMSLRSQWTSLQDNRAISVETKGRRIEIAPSWQALGEKLVVYRQRHDAFKTGAAPIHSVLPLPQDLVTLTLAAFHARFPVEIQGLILSIETKIPVSSGLGSSSALILNLVQGLLRLTGEEMSPPDLLEFARGIEDFQHGISSGLDLALVMARQPLVFLRGQGVIGTLPRPQTPLALVNSGKPSVSTGQCVEQVRRDFANDAKLWADFKHCTQSIQHAFTVGDHAGLKEGVERNHDLLDKIGVVPEKVRRFIAACRQRGIAAKTCGAGAVAGDNAGMVWALAQDAEEQQALKTIAEEHGYDYGLYAAAG